MRKPVITTVLAVATAALLAACGGSSSSSSSSGSGGSSGSSSSSSGGKSGGTATLVQGTAPQSIDPGLDFTTQGAETLWLRYLGLYSYAHASGTAGTQLIPAMATGQPVISDGGKTYTITLRPGLKYSNGTAVKASDFKFAVQRSIQLGWSAASFVTSNVVGAKDFSKNKAKSISGITTDDAANKVVIHLLAPYGAFQNVLALAGTSPIPSSTPVKDQSSNPPPGFGPYLVKNVVPNVSYDLDINPTYASQAIPGIPPAKTNIHVKIESNTTTEASDVLNNNADVFDAGDIVPPALVGQVASQASDRYQKELSATTLYFFLNTKEKPFSSPLAREAVIRAIDRKALSRLDSGNLVPACYLLPPSIVGHPTAPCPYGDPNAAPDIATAKKLVQQSGMAGQPVTVWGQMRQPRLEYTENLVATLNSIGFKATLKPIADHEYFSTIETLKNHPQAGFADWQQDFPNPTDFYQNLVDGNAIAPVGNSNYEEVNDPHIQSELKALYAVPGSQLQGSAARWQALEQYVAKQAFLAVYGYEYVPKFTSNRVNFSSLVFHPLYWNDFDTLTLK